MSNFENSACKVMGIILILLLSFLSVQLMGCTTIGWTDSGAPIVRQMWAKEDARRLALNEKKQSFSLLDNRGILHKYKTRHSTSWNPQNVIQVYCGSHYKWETLRIVWRRDKLLNQVWKWTYIVR